MYNISDYILEKLYVGKGFKVDADKHKPISENEFMNLLFWGIVILISGIIAAIVRKIPMIKGLIKV